MPRTYRMVARAAAVQETRRRIIQGSKALHADRGILGTSYEAIARQVGTSTATVYRHFPTLDHLVVACAQTVHVLRPLTPDQAAETFRAIASLADRLQVLVGGTFDCYERDQGWLRAARREEGLVSALREVVRVQRENLRQLTAAALASAGASERTVRIVAALIDFPVWQALRDAGLTGAETVEEVVGLARYHLSREGAL